MSTYPITTNFISSQVHIPFISILIEFTHTYKLAAEGANGQLPNMDLFSMTVQYSRRTALKAVLPTELVKTLVPSNLLSRLKEEMVVLFNFMLTLAVGVPTGDHGIFTQYPPPSINLLI